MVTDLDLAAERLIVGHIRAEFPRHRIIAEESGLLDAADSSWAWLVDPMDGTNNVAIGLNIYVVGVALCLNGAPMLGVVHDPVSGQTWSAVRGGGTEGPTGLVPPTERRAGHGGVVAWAQGYGVGRDDPAGQALRLTLESRVRRMLALWAPLLAWVMLARGDIDGFDGRPFDERIDQPHDLSFVAAHPRTVSSLLDTVRAAEGVAIDGL